jgi:hypothetical protein
VPAAHRHRGEPRLVEQPRRHRRIAVHELRTELDRHAGARLEQREHASAHAVARLEHDDALPRSCELARRHQPRGACADDQRVGHLPRRM